MKTVVRDYLELTKPRITLLILICAAVGYWFGCGASFDWTILAHALLGTALLASGTSALNQWYEVDSDARMRRTSRRPLPAGRIKRRNGLAFGLLLSTAGFADLWCRTNLLAAALGLFTLLSYLLLYTPLKQRSPVCTTVGAIPGAMPPLIGYAAAGHGIGVGALALFLILFFWQFPHFDSIAWLYRDDYRRGGIRMLPVIDSDGESTQAYRGLLSPVDPDQPGAAPSWNDGCTVRSSCDRRRTWVALFRRAITAGEDSAARP